MSQRHGGNRVAIAKKFGLKIEEILDFSANINPLGPPRAVFESIHQSFSEIAHYPEDGKNLKIALGDYLNVPPQNILLGNGSVELIFFLVSIFRPQRGLLFYPSFCEYNLALNAFGSEVISFPLSWRKKEAISWEEVIRFFSFGSMLFLAQPNNPTGTLVSRAELLFFLERALRTGVIVIIDEAFMDFVEERGEFSLVQYAAARKNLVVLGSLTKFFSLAGLRLGYLVAHQELIKSFQERRYPWGINLFAQIAGLTALRDKEFIAISRKAIPRYRQALFESLAKILGLRPHLSEANFLLVEIINGLVSGEVFENLAKQGILVRDCVDFPGLGEKFIRVAVRKPEENKALVRGLKEIFKEDEYVKTTETTGSYRRD